MIKCIARDPADTRFSFSALILILFWWMFAPPAAQLTSRSLLLIAVGCTLAALATMAWAVALLACGMGEFSANIKQTSSVVSTVCQAQHYVFLVPLLVPVTAWFAIANWVGWEYFRYA